MKLAFSTLCCPDWKLEQIAVFAREHGIGGIDLRGLGDEIDVTKLPAFHEHLPSTLALLKRYALDVPCLNTSVTLVTPASDRWQQMLDECQRNAMLAERTHTRYLRVFGGVTLKGVTRDEALVLARRHLRQLVKICRAFGCQLLVETHDEWSTSAAMLELVHDFDPDDAGVLWDIEHSYRRGEKPDETYSSLRRFIRHVHIKDSTRSGDRSTPKLLGDGDLPVINAVQLLRANRYDGWICLETEKRWNADAPKAELSIPRFVQFMRAQSGAVVSTMNVAGPSLTR